MICGVLVLICIVTMKGNVFTVVLNIHHIGLPSWLFVLDSFTGSSLGETGASGLATNSA